MAGFLRSCDRKTKFYETQKNTLGLLPGPTEVGGTCPYATRGPGGCFHVEKGRTTPTCYACKILRIYKCANHVVTNNTDTLRSCKTVDELTLYYDHMLNLFKLQNEEYAMIHEQDVRPKDLMYFRWHWCGDIESELQAKAMAKSMEHNKDIKFWTYTRSFKYASVFKDTDNLILYLSLDNDNWREGVKWFFKLGFQNDPIKKIAYMSKSIEDVTSMLSDMFKNPKKFSSTSPQKVVEWVKHTKVSFCPNDLGLIPTEFACSKCKQCITKGNQLLFFKC